MRTPLCLLAILSVAACSGGGGSSTTSSSGGTAAANGAVGVNFETFAGIAAAEGAAADTVDFVAARDALDASTADLLNGKPLSEIHNTAFNEIPVRGSATYDGLIGIEAGDDLELAAGIEINATFRTRSLSAEQTTQFHGVEDGALVAYDGELDFTRGSIGIPDAQNDVQFDVDGALVNGDTTVGVAGQISGKLIGTPVVAISGRTETADPTGDGLNEEGLALTINDEAVTGAVEFITTLRPEAPVAATE